MMRNVALFAVTSALVAHLAGCAAPAPANEPRLVLQGDGTRLQVQEVGASLSWAKVTVAVSPPACSTMKPTGSITVGQIISIAVPPEQSCWVAVGYQKSPVWMGQFGQDDGVQA